MSSLLKQPATGIFDRLQKALASSATTLLAYSDDTGQILQYMQRIALQSGLAIYAWSSSRGLESLKSRNMPVPGTRGLADALRYADRSNHYGIYLFMTQTREDLLEMQTVLPRHRSWEKSSDKKKLLFVLPTGKPLPVLENSKKVVPLDLNPKKVTRIGLRDGNWVPLND